MIDVFALAKGLAGLKGPLGWLWRTLTIEIFVVRDVKRALKALDFDISQKQLRVVLVSGKFRSAIETDSSATKAEAFRAFGEMVTSGTPGDARGEQVFRLVQKSYLRRLPVGSALVLSNAQVISTVDQSTAALGAQLDERSTDVALFEHRLENLHPLRAQEAASLQASWPGMAEVIGRMDRSGGIPELLRGWATSTPRFLESAPPEVNAWLGQYSQDLRVDEAADTFYKDAIDDGVSSAGYWTVRKMWIKPHDEKAARAILEGASPHPLVDAALADLDKDRDRVVRIVAEWRPLTSAETSAKLTIQARMACQDMDFDAAIQFGREALETFGSSSGGMIAAEAMVFRDGNSASALRSNDLSQALATLLTVRDNRRRWGFSSGAAVAKAMHVRRLLSDPEGASSLAKLPPNGEATEAEAVAPEVRVQLAMMAADRGDVDEAKALLKDTTATAYERTRIDALLAEQDGDSDLAADLWRKALASTDNGNEKADACLQLAFLGISDPYIAELAVENQKVASELRTIAALYSKEQGSVQQARSSAASSSRMLMILVQYFEKNGDNSNAAQLLREGAQRWNDADLWMQLAWHTKKAGETASAIDAINSALLAATSGWGGHKSANRLLVECYSTLKDWEAAARSASSLVEREPRNPSAIWALVICQFHVGDRSEALETWNTHGRPHPTDEWQVMVWIDLLDEFGAQVGTEADLVVLASEWALEETIRRRIVTALLFQAPTDQDEEIDQPAESNFLAEYLKDFPDAGYFIPIEVDLENPIDSIVQAIGERPDTSEFDARIASGEFPIGASTEIHGRTYAETIVLRASGARYASAWNATTERRALVAAMGGQRVVIDTTAAFTRSLLPDDLGAMIFGSIPSLVATNEQYLDSQQGHRSLQRVSGLAFVPAQAGRAPRFELIDDDAAASQLRLAQRTVDAFKAVVRLPHTELVTFPRTEDHDAMGVWLSAVDIAAADGLILWADDTALRKLADSMGVQSFGTLELLKYLREDHVLAEAMVDVADATLVANFYVSVPFSKSMLELSLTLQGQKAHSVAASYLHATGDEASARVTFALAAMSTASGNPDAIRDWAFCLSAWMVNVTSTPDAQESNLGHLSKLILNEPWLTADTLPFVVEGFRAGVEHRGVESQALFDALRLGFEYLARATQFDQAAEYYFQLVSSLKEEDRVRFTESILSSRP
ncbi:tetratricopeptide repeat protein [Cryobacterium soli]|uniref:tetratricopeptide repeat protein n=1 Tax=Cryobacterium soli TaxID=2220095 RepID=UPI0013C4782F|nr:hypothetical protein [Cryobacterium soli]